MASVVLDDNRTVHLDQPYGHEHVLEKPGSFRTTVLLSPINERIQVYSYEADDFRALADSLRHLAALNDYGKIWVKVPAADRPAFEDAGFLCEATFPGYFDGADGASMAIFAKPDRLLRPTGAEEDDILRGALGGAASAAPKTLPEGYTTTLFTDADADDLAALYATVFPTYPYPIADPAYLRETAASHIVYRLVRNAAGELVAAASAETNPALRNSEMTDFAALPSERGKGLAQVLLPMLERDAADRHGIRSFYTIARALSFGMLRTFHNCGYELTGTLVNNCNIAGKFETMHVLARK